MPIHRSARPAIKKAMSNDFLRHNLIFFVGSSAVAVINYLYYPVLGRLLTTTQFGEIQALVSLFLQVALLLSVVADVTVNIVANATDTHERNQIVFEFERLTTGFIVMVMLVALLFVHQLEHFLHFTSPWPFVILAGCLVATSLSTMRSAFLRGTKSFGQLSINNLLGAVSKLIFSVIFVLVGFKTNGAIGGLLAAQLLTFIAARYATKKQGLKPEPGDTLLRLPKFSLVKPQLPYASLVLIVSLVTTVFFSIDIILAKHYFSPKTAGLYAGIATIARSIYYLGGSTATVLLSSVHMDASAHDNRRLFIKSLALMAALNGVALVIFAALPSLIIRILLGSKYLPLAHLLPRLSLAMFAMAIISLVFSYDVALRRWSIAIVALLGTIITTGLIVWQHSTPSTLVNSLLLGSIAFLVIRGFDSVRRNLLPHLKQSVS